MRKAMKKMRKTMKKMKYICHLTRIQYELLCLKNSTEIICVYMYMNN